MAILRSLGAVLAGIVFIVGASTGADLALEHTILPAMNTAEASPPLLLALALAYRALFGMVGGWIIREAGARAAHVPRPRAERHRHGRRGDRSGRGPW